MLDIDFDGVKKIYFVGIGGIGMSATAGLAKAKNFDVSGSDSKEVYAPAKDVLDTYKIPYTTGYDEKNIEAAQADLYILSSGEGQQNPEVAYIEKHNLPHCSFAELLYHLFKDNLRIVVAGTNGKSTTTGLLGHLFKNLDNSTFMAGAVLQNYESNFYLGDGNYVIFEGDEYKAEYDDPTPKFHFYKPDILVLTNLEYDHPDLFASFEDLQEEFRQLIAAMPDDGLIIYNGDDAELAKLVHESNVSSVSFGIHNETDYQAQQIKYDPDFTTIDISNKYARNLTAQLLGHTEQYKTQLPGEINVYNALAAIATVRALGFAQEQIALDMLSYKGIKRRFEVVGKKNGITIIDDYAHHPTAIRETLAAARLRYFGDVGVDLIRPSEGKIRSSPTHEDSSSGHMSHVKGQRSPRLWAIFEPHTFSRTKATLEDLSKSFDAADEVLISEIYPAREKASEATIKSEDVVTAVLQSFSPSGGDVRSDDRTERVQKVSNVRLVHNKQEALDIIKTEAKPGDVIIVMAVGAFNRLAYELKEIL